MPERNIYEQIRHPKLVGTIECSQWIPPSAPKEFEDVWTAFDSHEENSNAPVKEQ